MVAAPPEVTAEVHQGIHEWLRRRGFGRPGARHLWRQRRRDRRRQALLRQPGVDGLFVGRAGLDPHRFAAIVRTPLPVSSGHILSDGSELGVLGGRFGQRLPSHDRIDGLPDAALRDRTHGVTVHRAARAERDIVADVGHHSRHHPGMQPAAGHRQGGTMPSMGP